MGELDLTNAAAIASGVLTALIGLPIAIHKLMRMFRSDRNDDTQMGVATDLFQSQQEMIKDLDEQIETRNKRIDAMLDRIGDITKDLTESQVENAELRVTNKHLTEQLQKVAHQLKNANQKIDILILRLPSSIRDEIAAEEARFRAERAKAERDADVPEAKVSESKPSKKKS